MHVKRIYILILVLCLLLGLCSCAGRGNNTDGLDEARIENETEVYPKTVAVLFSSYAEIWNLAEDGLDNPSGIAVTVGESIERGFADDSAIIVDATAGHSSIDLEQLIAAKPDLVIGTADYECQVEAVEVCKENGIDARAYHIETFEDYLGVLRELCDITGNDAAYKKYGTDVETEVDEILASERAVKPSVLFLRAGSSARSVKAKRADNNFVCVMIDELGAYNIADVAPVLLDGLSLEEIVAQNPDVILISPMGDEAASRAYMEELFTENGWRDLDAIKNKQYYFLDKELFHFKPNERWAEAYQNLIDLLY